MKYRRLDNEELEIFKDDFIKFLAINGIDADTWQDLKKNDKEAAEGVLDSFSDMIHDTVLRKILFMEQWSNNGLNVFQFASEKIVWIGIKSPRTISRDTFLKDIAESDCEIFMLDKTYSKSREEEMFDMMKKGCEPSDGELFKKMSIAYANNITTDR